VRHIPFVIAVGMASLGCSGMPVDSEESLHLPDVREEMPARLSSIGLYPDAPDLDIVARGAFAYSPRFPLWSDGGEKQRFVAVPDTTDAAPAPYPEEFPLGTVFFKTFSFETERDAGLRPVETRVMRLEGEGWKFYRYLWREDASDAELLTSPRSEFVGVLSDGHEFEHEVPSTLDCKTCHEASDSPVLGYRQVQLDSAPLSPGADPVTEQVLGYVLGNCTHCHNGSDSEAGVLDLRPSVFLDSTIDELTRSTSFAYGLRIDPGHPEQSMLFVALTGDDEDVKPMPPLGVAHRDQDAIELFRSWIEGL